MKTSIIRKRYFRFLVLLLSIIFTYNFLEISTIEVRAIENEFTPNIQAILSDDCKEISVNKGKTADVTYEIEASPFQYGENNQEKDIVLIVDTTLKNNKGQGHPISKVVNNIMENMITQNYFNAKNIKMSVIAFDEKGIIDNKSIKALTDDMHRLNQCLTEIRDMNVNDDKIGNIDGALIEANNILKQSTNNNKNIIIFGFGKINFGENDKSYLEEIKNENYNIFANSYDIVEGNNTLRELYLSIGGKVSNGLYDDFSIISNSMSLIDAEVKAICDKITDKLMKYFLFRDVTLNFDLGDNIERIIGSNLIPDNVFKNKCSLNIPQITYTRSENMNPNGKYTYTVEKDNEIDNITFKVRPTIQSGEITFTPNPKDSLEIELLNNYISYTQVNEKIAKSAIETPRILVKDPYEMNINAILSDVSPSIVGIEDEISVTYNINADEFISSNDLTSGGKIEQALFVVDLSQKMNLSQRFSMLQNGLVNKIVSNESFKNTEFGVIGYKYEEQQEKVFIGDRVKPEDPKEVTMKLVNGELINPLFAMNDGNVKDGFRKLFQDSGIKSYFSNDMNSNSERKVDLALTTANDILDNFGDSNKKKAIVFITAGNTKYSDEAVGKMNALGYKIITVDISNEANTNIEELHKNLGGKTEDYFVGTINGENYNNTDDDMKKVADSLLDGIAAKEHISVNASLKFDLSDNFNLIENSMSDNIISSSYKNNNLNIKLPSINFRLNRIEDKEYIYSAESFDISFKIKISPRVDNTQQFLRFSNYDDAETNNINYIDIFNKEVIKLINTPEITLKRVEVSDLHHGLYNGIVNNNIEILENVNGNSLKVSPGMNMTFGIKFNLNGSASIKLMVDDGLENVDIDKIKVYKVKNKDSNISLEELDKIITKLNNKNFNIDISEAMGESTQILIVYQGKITTNDIKNNFENYIIVDKFEKLIRLHKNGIKLPELF